MRNKFKGLCYKCGKPVEVGQGFFEKIRGKSWKVKHATGTIQEKKRCLN